MTKFTESMTAILEAMKAGGVDRIITMSAWYTDPNTRQQLIHTISFPQIRDQRFDTNERLQPRFYDFTTWDLSLGINILPPVGEDK